MVHTENKIQDYKGIISSLLRMFSMFKISLSFGDEYLDTLSLNFINCKIETSLNSETSFDWVYDEILAKSLLNAMLHHVGMSWIIRSNKEMNYEISTESNHIYWLNKGPWYNRNICSKLNGSRFEDY